MIYERLLSLYKKNKNSKKTPLEDFTTEVLVGILESDNEVLDNFVNNILKIPGEDFFIDSQVKYNLEDEINCIIDMVVKNDKYVCFIENKVYAGEGERQLERYTKVLKNIEKSQDKKVELRYCTKYYDLKEINYVDFLQYRWSDVYRFLQEYKEDSAINEYLEFLRGEEMASAGEFNYVDLMALNTINSTMSKMDGCLEDVIITLSKVFNKPNQNYYERVKQISKDSEYTVWVNGIIEGEESYISVGFTFNEAIENVKIPFVNVDLCVKRQNSKFDNYKQKEDEVVSKFEMKKYSTDEQVLISFQKPLSDFLSMDKQNDEIVKWFNENIARVKDIIDGELFN